MSAAQQAGDLNISKKEVRVLHQEGQGGPYKLNDRPMIKKGLQKKTRPSSVKRGVGGGFNGNRYKPKDKNFD
jgi:hypothetical protein